MTYYPEPDWEDELDPDTETMKSINDDLEEDEEGEEIFVEEEPMLDDDDDDDDDEDEDEMEELDELEELERLERRVRKDEAPLILDEEE